VTARLPRVLVVDDDRVARQLIRVNLQLDDFEAFTAVDGVECMDRIRGIAPDVVTLDVMMPRLDGWQTAVRLRADLDLARIPIVRDVSDETIRSG
jgi:CheY-like chemotaxis protein